MPTDTMSMINTVWPFLLMGLVFYFMLYRPQKKEQEKRTNMLNSLKVGDKVVTIGGIYGTIKKINETKAKIEIAENIEIDVVRSAISHFQDIAKQELAEK